MRRSDFNYTLPPELIARQPLPRRSASRLVCLGTAPGEFADRTFTDLPELLHAGDLLVWNDTRVIRARLFGRKSTGGRVEILIDRLLGEREALAQIRASKAVRSGTRIVLDDGTEIVAGGRDADGFHHLALMGDDTLDAVLDRAGHVPLPPYIDRPDTDADAERYQTVYAQVPGAVAAPTAGLHFDEDLIARVRALGVAFGRITLHVGAGTFQPVRVDDLAEHRMHTEWLRVDTALCAQVAEARARGGRVIAVGTTSVRALETAVADGELAPLAGETRLFITPGYRFRVVDALITNFHLPESTLLMLVCAFGGYDRVMRAYQYAIAERYRFYSYGDAMWLTPGSPRI